MNKFKKTALLLLLIAIASWLVWITTRTTTAPTQTKPTEMNNKILEPASESRPSHPMSIESLRARDYPGGDFTIEQTLSKTATYDQFIASYISDGLRIRGLLTIPTSVKPDGGFPAIVFVHGYIPPKEYSVTKNYSTYQAVLARNGFITFKPDLRGHDQSEGEPVSAHFSEAYVVDTLNAISYLKQHKDVNPERIGYWGHSNGGEIGLRSIVVTNNIKAASLWAGVVGSFPDMLELYNDKIPFLKDSQDKLVLENGLPNTNPEFWNKIDPYNYLSIITAKVQLQHGTNDKSVPVELSRRLEVELKKANKSVEYFEYPGDDHNIKNNFTPAWQRAVKFFKDNL